VIPGHQTELESLFWLDRRYDGAVHARVTRPHGASIYTQLVKLKSDHPDASAAELAGLIAVETREDDQRTLPALARLADEFEKIRLSPALSDEIMMDPTRYFVRVESASGEQLELVVYGPGSTAPHQPNPLLTWVEELRRQSREAGGKKNGSYYPLAVGNWWSYTVSGPSKKTRTVKWQVVRKEKEASYGPEAYQIMQRQFRVTSR